MVRIKKQWKHEAIQASAQTSSHTLPSKEDFSPQSDGECSLFSLRTFIEDYTIEECRSQFAAIITECAQSQDRLKAFLTLNLLANEILGQVKQISQDGFLDTLFDDLNGRIEQHIRELAEFRKHLEENEQLQRLYGAGPDSMELFQQYTETIKLLLEKQDRILENVLVGQNGHNFVDWVKKNYES